MKRAFDISGLMRSALMAVLSLLLSAQVALSFVSYEAPLKDGEIRSIICGPEGFLTVTIDLVTGEVDVTHSETVQDRCPFCVVGAALVAPGFVAPERITEFHLAALDLPADLTAEPTRPEGLRAIRAPPASL
ncbi:hypothetical protein [Pseudothioclava arenosa]|uniref:DUF2946 domain-containing protein n=1 Tax=Pseudothioclava arenosa TaxID=1795308 RepID=A0A2A4CSS5_9RHOB|nr:hypothetical protein [Pseudothioclava arenosa]PCD77547.1 hypothetical protein CLN94_03320 [Pseudothioclava arenosa]